MDVPSHVCVYVCVYQQYEGLVLRHLQTYGYCLELEICPLFFTILQELQHGMNPSVPTFLKLNLYIWVVLGGHETFPETRSSALSKTSKNCSIE